MDIPVRHVISFLAVVECGSITAAAAATYISQPALSRQIALLESEIGVQLFERLARETRLTPAGRALVEPARAAAGGMARFTRAAERLGRSLAGELHVGTMFSLNLGAFPTVLQHWRALHPDVDIRVVEHRHHHDLLETLNSRRIDIAIGPLDTSCDFQEYDVGLEPFVIVLPDDGGVLADGGTADLADLAASAWVHYAEGNSLGEVLDRACASAGFTPIVRMRTEQAVVAAQLAGRGLGAALVPANLRSLLTVGTVVAPREPITRRIVAYANADLDPVAQAFVDTFIEHADLAGARTALP